MLLSFAAAICSGEMTTVASGSASGSVSGRLGRGVGVRTTSRTRPSPSTRATPGHRRTRTARPGPRMPRRRPCFERSRPDRRRRPLALSRCLPCPRSGCQLGLLLGLRQRRGQSGRQDDRTVAQLAVEVVQVVGLRERGRGLLSEGRQARQLREHRLLPLAEQVGLPTQLLLAPGELLLGALADGGGLLLGRLDPVLGLLDRGQLQLVGVPQGLLPDPGGLEDVGFQPGGRLLVVAGGLASTSPTSVATRPPGPAGARSGPPRARPRSAAGCRRSPARPCGAAPRCRDTSADGPPAHRARLRDAATRPGADRPPAAPRTRPWPGRGGSRRRPRAGPGPCRSRPARRT